MTYTKLFEKGHIGNLELKNRIVMTAMGCSFANSNGEASDEIIKYYAERARGGVGLIITEIVRVDEETGIGTHHQLSATHGKHIPGLVRLAEAVHAYDTKIFAQLHHPGNETPSRLIGGKQPVSASDVTCAVIGEKPRALTTEEVEAMVKKFVTAAVIVKTAGFDGVEVHAAHGYLVNQFLSPHTNKREDKYGGSFEKRLTFLTEIVMGIKAYCGPTFPISVRISADEFIEDGLKLEDGIKIAKHLENLGVSCINVSSGTYESGATVIEPYSFKSGWRKHLAANVKANVNVPVIAANTIKTPEFAESLLEEGVSDFVGLGRGLLADPNWANKAKNSQDHLIRKCIGCLECFKILNQGRPLECTVNPILGRELHYGERNFVKNGNGKVVGVVGAGPAGMQAAVVLAKRGFKPILFEKEAVLGGTLNLADKPPMKSLITELTKTLANEVQQLGIEVRLNTEATVDTLKKAGVEAVFVTTGGQPIVPNLPGVEKAIKAEDILSGRVNVEGKKVAIIGGGVTGLETAELISPNNTVTVVEMLNAVGTTLYPSVGRTLLARLAQNNVTVLTGHALKAVNDTNVELTVKADNSETTLDTELTVLALGVRPNTALIEEYENAFDEVVVAGDAARGGTIRAALHQAYDKAFAFND